MTGPLQPPAAIAAQGIVTVAEVRVDLGLRLAHTPSGDRDLSQREVDLLAYLARCRGRDVSREELLLQVWGHARAGETRAVDMAVMRLRKKLQPDPAGPAVILASRGDGYRLAPPTAPAPPPSPAPARRGNLERPVGACFGREAQLAGLMTVLEEGERVVCLTGPPGVGKSRLARELGWRAVARGDLALVGWVDLSPAADLGDLCLATAAALGLCTGQQPGAPQALAGLAAALAGGGRTLLILDQAERLPERVAQAVDAWIARAPQLVVVVTSQVRTFAHGERVCPVQPLGLDDARQLFLDRAARAGAPPIHPEDLPHLSEIVRSLDGLPLALELAAARAHLHAPADLARRLGRGGLLSARSSGAGRHASLDAALGWAWDLLGPAERDALVLLSPFEGGFTRDAALRVLQTEEDELLDALIDRSLVGRLPDRPGLPARLDLLQAVASYARARGSPARVAQAAERLAAWCAQMARAAVAALQTDQAGAALELLAADGANLAVAARHLPPGPDLCAVCLALAALHGVHGMADARDAALARAVAAAAGHPRLQAQAILSAVRARVGAIPVPQAEAALDEALGLLQGEPPCLLRAEILHGLSRVYADAAQLEAETEAALRGQAEAEAAGEPLMALFLQSRAVASASWRLGWLERLPDELHMLRQAYTRHRAAGLPFRAMEALGGLVAALDMLGRTSESLRLREEAVEDATRLRIRALETTWRRQRGLGLLRAHRFVEAVQELERVQTAELIAGAEAGVTRTRFYLAMGWLHQRRYAEVAGLIQQLDDAGRLPGSDRWRRIARMLTIQVALDRGQGEAAVALLLDRAQGEPLEGSARETSMYQGLLGMAHGLCGDWEPAARCFAAIGVEPLSTEFRLCFAVWRHALTRARGDQAGLSASRAALQALLAALAQPDAAAWRALLHGTDPPQPALLRAVAEGRSELAGCASSHYLRLAARGLEAAER